MENFFHSCKLLGELSVGFSEFQKDVKRNESTNVS